MINAIGNLGGWLGPWVFGLVKDATGSDNIALLCLASAPVVSAIVVIAGRATTAGWNASRRGRRAARPDLRGGRRLGGASASTGATKRKAAATLRTAIVHAGSLPRALEAAAGPRS